MRPTFRVSVSDHSFNIQFIRERKKFVIINPIADHSNPDCLAGNTVGREGKTEEEQCVFL